MGKISAAMLIYLLLKSTMNQPLLALTSVTAWLLVHIAKKGPDKGYRFTDCRTLRLKNINVHDSNSHYKKIVLDARKVVAQERFVRDRVYWFAL